MQKVPKTCIGLQNLFPGDGRHSSIGKSCADYSNCFTSYLDIILMMIVMITADYSNCFTSHLEIVIMIVMGTISYDSMVIVIMTSIIVIGFMAPPYCSTDTTGPCSP